ncbi:MAG: hypothetical protein M0037_00590 [Betaproteobacteria bacterium]|nr:hypothetical protein [Betaproteobacteria bacterium]
MTQDQRARAPFGLSILSSLFAWAIVAWSYALPVLRMRAPWALAAAWVFNIWGTIDLLYAWRQGAVAFRASGSGPHALGAAFYQAAPSAP